MQLHAVQSLIAHRFLTAARKRPYPPSRQLLHIKTTDYCLALLVVGGPCSCGCFFPSAAPRLQHHLKLGAPATPCVLMCLAPFPSSRSYDRLALNRCGGQNLACSFRHV